MSKFEKGLELLRRDGWSAGSLYEPVTGKRCALGALHGVNIESHSVVVAYDSCKETNILADLIVENYPDWYASMTLNAVAPIDSADIVAAFNDMAGRTQDEIEALFEKGLAKEEEEYE
jgi:hypothetical protein